MERLEHSAKILAIAHSLGGIHPLPETEINTLKSMRRQLGEQTR